MWSLLTIGIPVLNTRTQLALGHGMLNSLTCLLHYLYKYALVYRSNYNGNSLRLNICSVSLLLDFFLVFVFFISCTRTLWYALLPLGLHRAPQYGNKV